MTLTYAERVFAHNSKEWEEVPDGWELLFLLSQRSGTQFSCMMFIPNTKTSIEALGGTPREAWNLACMVASKKEGT